MSTETRARATIAGLATATALLALLAVGGAVAGGGSDTTTPIVDDQDVGTPTVTTGPYQPLTVGTTWTYHVDDQGVVYDKQSAVEAFEDMGGAIAGHHGLQGAGDGQGGDPAHLVRADGHRRPAPPRSARRRHRPHAVRRVV
jgi:hypothetical protein